MTAKEYFSTGEVAQILDISRATVSRKFDDGTLTGKKNPITGERLISRESLTTFMKQYDLNISSIDKDIVLSSESPAVADISAINILLGSPDETFQHLISQTFAQDNRINLEITSSGYDALIKCSQNPPDLFIIDEEMSDIYCAELVKSLKRTDFNKSLKILCCLKDYDPAKIDKIKADDYIVKNKFTETDLIHKIKYLGFLFESVTGNISQLQIIEEHFNKSDEPVPLHVLSNKVLNDFNNILTSIFGNISLARILLNDKDSEISEILEDVETATRLAKDLSTQLRLFSKSEALIPRSLSIPDILDECCSFVLRNSPIACDISTGKDIWPVFADEDLIKQAINNIITNAIEAMPHEGTMTISAENVPKGTEDTLPPDHDFVKITFYDKGIGIPHDFLFRIFDPYFTTKSKVSGLGLTFTKSIITKHNGFISVDSEINKGTTVRIFLPSYKETEVKTTHPPAETISVEPGRILVFDDEPTILKVISRMLQHLGHEYELASDGDETVELYRQAKEAGKPFDIVILDLIAPSGMGAIEILAKLTDIDPDVSAVLSTGDLNNPVVSEYKDHGFRSIIAKPYELDQLLSVINQMLI